MIFPYLELFFSDFPGFPWFLELVGTLMKAWAMEAQDDMEETDEEWLPCHGKPDSISWIQE